MPTASSAQTKKRISRIIKVKANFSCVDFIFLVTISMQTPVINSSEPIIIKSVTSQFTSLVNCIATNGIDNSPIRIPKIMNNLCVTFVVFSVFMSSISL